MMNENGPNIDRFFEPRSVAVIGASSKKGKVGYKLMDNILSADFKRSCIRSIPGEERYLAEKRTPASPMSRKRLTWPW
jgi:predicted CoA-binding protein